MKSVAVLLSIIAMLRGNMLATEDQDRARNQSATVGWLKNLPPDAIMGIDRRGTPLVCGRDHSTIPTGSHFDPAMPELLAAIPTGTRMWEPVPGVVRNDGLDTFRLEVHINGPVSNVVLEVYPPVLSQSGQLNLSLRDDGLQGDRM